MKKTLTIAGKGGEGKTTMAINLAYAFAKTGHPVTIVDLNEQRGGLSDLLGCSGVRGVSELYQGERGIFPANVGRGVSLLACGEDIEGTFSEINFTERPEEYTRLRNYIHDLPGIKIVDTPPMLGNEVMSAFLASDFVFCVSSNLDAPMSRIHDITETIEMIQRLGLETNVQYAGLIASRIMRTSPKLRNTFNMMQQRVDYLGAVPFTSDERKLRLAVEQVAQTIIDRMKLGEVEPRG